MRDSSPVTPASGTLTKLACTATVALASLASAPGALAWGCRAHHTVAYIAETYLTPQAKQTVLAVLAASPVDPKLKRYCGNAATDPVADASTWADDVRSERKNGPWHYIDIPRGQHQGSLEAFCGSDGCVTRAIVEQLAVYKNKAADPGKRADALRYVIHFVGDLHQPLHAITNADSGGNCVPVKYLDYEPLPNAAHPEREDYSPNLHQIWDTELAERDMEISNPRRYADALVEKFRAKASAIQTDGLRIEDWAWESHERAEHDVYELLSSGIAIEPDVRMATCADNNHMGKRMFAKHFAVGDHYAHNAAGTIERSLWEAGVRLAVVLNEAENNAP